MDVTGQPEEGLAPNMLHWELIATCHYLLHCFLDIITYIIIAEKDLLANMSSLRTRPVG